MPTYTQTFQHPRFACHDIKVLRCKRHGYARAPTRKTNYPGTQTSCIGTSHSRCPPMPSFAHTHPVFSNPQNTNFPSRPCMHYSKHVGCILSRSLKTSSIMPDHSTPLSPRTCRRHVRQAPIIYTPMHSTATTRSAIENLTRRRSPDDASPHWSTATRYARQVRRDSDRGSHHQLTASAPEAKHPLRRTHHRSSREI